MLTIALAAALSLAPVDSTRSVPRSIPELRARIEAILDSTHTPGVGVAIVSRDSVVWAAGLGLADVASKRPATERTLFRIGSTSKAFTSLALMMLVEQGRVSLDDPLAKYIPDVWFENRWESTDPVRIVNALEHTTGFDDLSFASYANSDPTPLTLEEGLEVSRSNRVSRWRPGTRVAYCNSGPALVAYVVEKVTGQSFDQLAEERLFRPIGMPTATYLYPDTTRVPMATLYHADGVTPFPYWHVVIRPAGSINASAIDMAAYVRFLLNRGTVDGQPLLTPASIERMEHSERSLEATAGLPVSYGLHLATYVDSGFVWVGHDGGVNGGLTNMAYLPDAGVGFAFMINSANGKSYGQIGQLIRDYLTRDLPKPTPPAVAPLSSLARTTYTGWYRPDNPRNERFYFLERLGLLHVTATDSGLRLGPILGAAQTVLPVSDRLFRGPTEPVPTLALMDDSQDGRPVAIERMGYLLPLSMVRISTASAWLQMVLTVLWVAGLLLTALVAVGKLLAFVIRKVRRRAPRRPTTGLFWWPFWTTAALAVAAFLTLRAVGAGDATVLGTPSALSIGLFLVFLAYGLLALIGFGAVLFRPRLAGQGARWASRTAVSLQLIGAVYLTYWGLIGWRPWT
jgi:CubicO group peptidase (beta-lactamase class C family)